MRVDDCSIDDERTKFVRCGGHFVEYDPSFDDGPVYIRKCIDQHKREQKRRRQEREGSANDF